jgi:hypothetical protein
MQQYYSIIGQQIKRSIMTKSKKLNIKRRRTRNIISLAVSVVATAVLGIAIIGSSHAASGSSTGTISLSPASGSYTVGDTVTVDVYENSGITGINAANIVLSYPQADLQFLSFDATGSGFNYPGSPVSNVGGGGSVTYETNEAGTSLTGNQLVVAINFQVLAAGTATISVSSSSGLANSSGVDINPALTGSSFTLSNPVQSGGGGGGGGSTGGGGGSSGGSSGGGSSGSSGGGSVVSHPPAVAAPSNAGSSDNSTPDSVAVTPNQSSTPVTLPDNSNAQVSAPITVSPTQSSAPLAKVEYFLNNKLVAVVNHAPYTYKINTNKLRNGKYTLTTKTFYTTGKIALASENLSVKNPLSAEQFWLQIDRYLWLLFLIVLAVAVYHYIKNIRSIVSHFPKLKTATIALHDDVDIDKYVSQRNVIAPSNGSPISSEEDDIDDGDSKIIRPSELRHARDIASIKEHISHKTLKQIEEEYSSKKGK